MIPSPNKSCFFYKKKTQKKQNMLLQIPGVGGHGLTFLTDGSTPEPHLRLCLSCFEKHSSCCVVFMPRPGYCTVCCPSGTASSWKSCKMNIPAQDPGCCSLAGLSGLTLVVLSHGSSPAHSKTSSQPIFILLSSSWRSKVWLSSSTGAFELPWSWNCSRTHTSCLDPEEQSSRKMCHCRQKGLQGKLEKSRIKSSCCNKVFSKEHFLTNTEHWSDLQYFFIVANISNFDVKYLKLTCNISSAGRFRSRTQQPRMPIPLPPSIFVAYV